MGSEGNEFRQTLRLSRSGDREALDRLVELLYDAVHSIAVREMRRERPDHTLQATALVNEAYLRLAGSRNLEAMDESAFLAAAATAIRRVLVDHARGKSAVRRGGERSRVAFEVVDFSGEESSTDIVTLNDLLEEFSRRESSRGAKLVELRFFAGLGVDDAARVLAISPRQAAEDWAFARAWLRRELAEDEEAG